MDEKYDHTQDDMVKDLNLEAKIDKEFFLHGFLRSDFTDDELKTLRDEIAMLQQGNCSVLNGFWSSKKSRKKKSESEDVEPIPKFAVGDRVWVTEHLNVEGIPGVGEVRKVITEWTDLGEELNGYWEVSYLLKNTRMSYSEDCVFATELEALTALAADFRRNAIAQASVLCRRMRALGMNISTKELIENLAEFI
jgi:hypothetical protein